MSVLGNVMWFILGGGITGLLWCFVGTIWSVTIVGIPIGMQCFKIARLCIFPFGKTVEYAGGAGCFLLNLLWICFTGWTLAVEATIFGVIYCITIIGIPFGKQYFKIAKLALMPFGAEINTK